MQNIRSTTIFAKLEHLDDILRIWGPNRQTLGLMPKDAFLDSIKKKWIILCIEDSKIVGYLQFRFTNRTQTLSIVHLCVEKSYRGRKYPELMVNRLVEEFRFQSRGIRLTCRTDYIGAQKFWNNYGFQPKQRKASRGSDPNVELVVWWYSFGKQDLFSINSNDKVKAILDFNIIAKMMDPEEHDLAREQILELSSDWLVTEVDYYYASETVNELFRDRDAKRQARTKKFLGSFIELNADKPQLKVMEEELRGIYPGKSDNDLSDRRQLSEAILSGFSYFITLDEGILKKGKYVQDKYNLKIVKPFQLRSEIDYSVNTIDYYPSQLSAKNFFLSKLKPKERNGLEEMFLNHSNGERKSAFNSVLDETIARPSGCVQTIKEKDRLVGLIGYHHEEQYLRVSMIRTKQYSLRQTIFMQNINDLLKLAISGNHRYLAITDRQITSVEKQILQNYGFFEVDNIWIRAIRSGIATLGEMAGDLAEYKKDIPELAQFFSLIEAGSDDSFYLDSYSLEKILWPLKIRDAQIPCYIIPIKPHYARELFDANAATSELFGVQAKLIWSKENVYYRSIKPNIEKFPARILWYASYNKHAARSKAIVSSSYLDEVVIGPAKELFKKHERFGIYSWDKDILPLAKGKADEQIKILRFSDSESFERPIPLSMAKRILAINGERDNNFQSPHAIKNSTFMALYALGKLINHEKQ